MEELLDTLGATMMLTDGEKVGITITEDDTTDLRSKSRLCLIGRLLSERRVQKDTFQVMMARLWRTLESVTFKEIYENMWLLEFATESNKRLVKDGRPWLFDRCVLVLKEVKDSAPPLQMDFTKALSWVQAHDMPLMCMNKEMGLWIGGTIGRVDRVDGASDGIGWGRCLRIQIFLDLTKPLSEVDLSTSMVNQFGYPLSMKNFNSFVILVGGFVTGKISAWVMVASG